jgi:SAM-dependent methyltransferase
MNIWFDATQALFEVFLEEKLNYYGCCVSEVGDVAPPELSMRTMPTDFMDDIHRQMEAVYFDLPSGFDATDCDGSEFLYGELTPAGTRQLAALISSRHADQPDANQNMSWTFVDFGCGTGKVVFELAQLLPAVHCIGVELSAERAMIGKIAAQQISASNLEIVCGSFFNDPSPDVCVTAAFCCGLGFDEALTRQLLDRLFIFGTMNVCVLLLRQDAKQYRQHPLFLRAVDVDFTARFSTTWMEEAPATVLRFK